MTCSYLPCKNCLWKLLGRLRNSMTIYCCLILWSILYWPDLNLCCGQSCRAATAPSLLGCRAGHTSFPQLEPANYDGDHSEEAWPVSILIWITFSGSILPENFGGTSLDFIHVQMAITEIPAWPFNPEPSYYSYLVTWSYWKLSVLCWLLSRADYCVQLMKPNIEHPCIQATHCSCRPKPGIDGLHFSLSQAAVLWLIEVGPQFWDLVKEGMLCQVGSHFLVNWYWPTLHNRSARSIIGNAWEVGLASASKWQFWQGDLPADK